MELAIINGTYRSGNDQSALAAAQLAAAKQPLAAALRKQKRTRRTFDQFSFSVAEAAALQQAQARGVLLAANPGLARSPTMAVAGAPIVMSPGRGATSTASATSAASQLTAAHQMFTLQSQLQSQNNVAAAQVFIVVLKSKIEFGIFRPSQPSKLSSSSNSTSRQPPQPRCKAPNTNSCS